MAKQSTPSWFASFLGCLNQGRADETLITYLDEFLEWYAAINAITQPPGIEHAIEMFGEQGLRVQFEEFIDQLVIANPNNYRRLFPSLLSREQAKTRYRHLIRIFHPDRGTKTEAWLTFRAERINKAYNNYLRGEGPRESSAHRPAVADRVPVASRRVQNRERNLRWAIRFSKERLRAWLGDPVVLQNRIVWGLTLVAITVVVMLLISALAN